LIDNRGALKKSNQIARKFARMINMCEGQIATDDLVFGGGVGILSTSVRRIATKEEMFMRAVVRRIRFDQDLCAALHLESGF